MLPCIVKEANLKLERQITIKENFLKQIFLKLLYKLLRQNF